MAKDVFAEQNRRRELQGQPLLANPRNAAAGSMRQLDPRVTRERELDIIVFNVQYTSGAQPRTHAESLDMLLAEDEYTDVLILYNIQTLSQDSHLQQLLSE